MKDDGNSDGDGAVFVEDNTLVLFGFEASYGILSDKRTFILL
jgi:hypothetical protein